MILHAGLRWFYRISFCIILISSKCFYSLKINPAVVLLPYNRGLPSNFTLEITESRADECFEWKSTNPQIVQVYPMYIPGEPSHPKCSKKALVSSIAYFLEKKVTQVTATLLGGEKTLYWNVITDNILNIRVQHIRDEIEIDGPPEVFTIIAEDKDGHIFSSVNGLPVVWQIYKSNSAIESPDHDGIIRLSNFAPSSYQSPEKENEFERRGMFSSSVLVEPLQVGTSQILAKFQSSPGEWITAVPISVKVVSNLKIHPPSPLYLLRHTSSNLKLKTLNKEEDITLEDFDANNGDSSVISLSSDFSHLSAKEYGESKITFFNKSRSDPLENPDMTLEVNVVKPFKIDFRISHGDYRKLEEMKIYEVYLDLYDEKGNLIYPADNLRISLKFPPKLFHVIHVTANGTYAVVQTLAPGSGKIKAEFKGVALEDGTVSREFTVSGLTSVSVLQKLNIFPPFTLLPISQQTPMYIIPLTVAGGTGHYTWGLSNNTAAKVVPIDDEGKNSRVELHVFDEVDLTITASDKTNLNFVTTAQVFVQTPADIETFPTVVEAEVGNFIIVPTALLGYEDKGRKIIRKFDDCSKADVKVDIIEKYVISHEKDANIPAFGRGCISLQFRCKMAGHSRVNMEYRVKNSTTDVFKTTTMLSCYKTLKPVHPVRVAVLALGTSMEVAFDGGPRKWPLHKEGHFTELDAENPEIVKIQLIKDPVRYNKDLTVFRVTCKDLGENTLTLKIGNNPSATIQHPAKSEAAIKFICGEPHSLHLKLQRKKQSKKLKDDNIVKVPFYGEKIFSVDVFLKDSKGRKFANISSLRITWDVSDKALANAVSNFDFVTHENAVSGYRKITRNFMDFKMRGLAGDLTVEAKVTSYIKDVLTKEEITRYKETEEISRSIDLKLVSLRDINEEMYESAQDEQDENGYCENDSCSS